MSEAEVLDRVFMKLTLAYGHDFLRRWEGLDMELVKQDWIHTLGGFLRSREALTYAVEHLPPGQPPTALQFRALCNARPTTSQPLLPAPEFKAEPERVQAIMAKIVKPMPRQNLAAELLDRLEAIERQGRPSAAQRAALQELRAKGVESKEAEPIGQFTPIPESAWPWKQAETFRAEHEGDKRFAAWVAGSPAP